VLQEQFISCFFKIQNISTRGDSGGGGGDPVVFGVEQLLTLEPEASDSELML